jgi:hypothetical protein
VPQNVPAPERPVEPQAEAAPEPQPEVDRMGIELPPDGDSFFDPTEPDAALAAEERRFAALHRRNQQRQAEREAAAQQRREMGMPTDAEIARQAMRGQQTAAQPAATRLDPRVSGLREAANLQDQVFDSRAGQQVTGRPQRTQPQPAPGGKAATLHGKPVFKMPAQTLEKPQTDRRHGEPPPGPMQVNPVGGSRQSKFRGPKQ